MPFTVTYAIEVETTVAEHWLNLTVLKNVSVVAAAAAASPNK